jgi:hypothetical protein
MRNSSEIIVCCVIFGDGSTDFKEAAQRLGKQANDLEIFDDVHVLDSLSLSQLSARYKRDLVKITTLTSFPLYFRAIKPWAILHFMEDTNKKYDVIFYIDAGCELPNNSVSKARLKRIIKKVYKYGAIAEYTGYKESSYSRKNLINAFEPLSSISSMGQIQTTWSRYKNSAENLNFMLEWIELSDPKYCYWQDPVGAELEMQSSDFIENRWDQSIFSLLYKKYHLPTKSTFWEYGGKFGNLRGLSIPIHATRNKTGKSELPIFHSNNYLAYLSLILNCFFTLVRPIKRSLYR